MNARRLSSEGKESTSYLNQRLILMGKFDPSGAMDMSYRLLMPTSVRVSPTGRLNQTLIQMGKYSEGMIEFPGSRVAATTVATC